MGSRLVIGEPRGGIHLTSCSLFMPGEPSDVPAYRKRFAVIPDIFSGRAVLVPEEPPAGEVFRLGAPDHPAKEKRKGRWKMSLELRRQPMNNPFAGT